MMRGLVRNGTVVVAALFAAGLVQAQPANDLCANATAQSDLTVISSNIGAATDGSATCGTGTNDVWFRYVASATGTASVDTCGSAFDTLLTAFAACGGAELACDNDSGCGNTSRITFAVTAGLEYRLRVASVDGSTGKIVITANTTPSGVARPANDDCANATDIGDGTASGSNKYATTDGIALCTDASGSDIWFRYTSPVSGTATITTEGSAPSTDTVLSAYDNCDGRELACNDDASNMTLTSSVTLDVIQGTKYLIRVASRLGQTGELSLHVSSSGTSTGGGGDTGGGDDKGGGGTDNGSGGSDTGGGDTTGGDSTDGTVDDPQIALAGCGNGLCGTGMLAMMPLGLLGIGCMKFGVARNRRRSRSL